ncbi:MAG TPA: c-type cytochrome [Gemmatimonadaceae bacterium]|nr:c-type cytochrome [Gemmatimonadaceae bacterium]
MRYVEVVMARAMRAAVVALALAACGDSQRQGTATTDSAEAVQGPTQTASLPAFTGDVEEAREGRRGFLEYNCYGCHGGLGGGGMGPSLRDSIWRYGGTHQAIVASVADGRPAGMPSFTWLMSEPEIRQVVTYIRSMRTRAEPTFFFAMDDTTTRAGTLER